MTKPTQDKETLREALKRIFLEYRDEDLAADAAIATMFERLRTPSHPMCGAGAKAIYEGLGSQGCWQAMLDKFQQENSECPSCGGLNISCPDGCGRDPITGELNFSRLENSDAAN